MNTINIYLKTSGSVAEIQKEFTLYTGSYQNTLVDVYVPTSILYSNEQNTYVNEIKIGGSSTAPNGSTVTTNPYQLNYVKVVNIEDGEVDDVPAGEYKVFETLLPKEFCVNPGTQVVSINVVSIDNTDTENPVLLGITTTQRCDLLVVASDLYEMGGETPDQWDVLVATVENHGERITNLEGDVSDIQGDIATINDEIDSVDPLNPGLKARITQAENDIDAIELEQDSQDLTIQANYNDINDPTTGLKQRVANLENTVITGETPIGTMEGSSLPTDQELTDFVVDETGRQPQGGDYIYFILQVAGGTDKNYKYFYGVNGWNGAEIPAMEKAANDTLGIIQGTYGENKDTEVSVINGKVDNIYVKDKSGTQKALRNYLNTNETAIENNTNDINDPTTGLKTKVATNTSNISSLTTEVNNIKNGTTVVPKSTSAENDGLNRNIANTYMTQTSGATKQDLKDYAMPRTFNDVSFVGADNLYTDTIPDTLSALYSATSTQIGDTTLFYVDKTISNAEFELGNKNSYTTTLYLTTNRDCSVAYRVTTQLYHNGAWTLLNAELTDVIDMVDGVMKKVNFGSPFNSMTDIVDVVSGDVIRQTFEVQTDFSTSTTYSIYSNSTYPSTFYLNTTAQTIIVAQGYLGEIPYYSLNGTLDDGTITFDVAQDLRENTLGMFKLNYSSTIDSGTNINLSHNGVSVRIITPYNYDNSNDATIDDLAQVYQNSTGLLFKGFIKTIGGDLSVIADIDNLDSIINYLEQIQTDLSGKLDKNTAIAGATKTKITYDSKGLVTAGADLQASDIPNLTLSKITDVTASANELNVLDGITATTTELNYVDGVTSNIQTQLNNKQASLDTTQMEAVNSGANSTNIGQISTNTSDIATINGKIPTQASTTNQLADKDFVNSSIATNTANFIGTFADIPSLNAYSGTITNNDYAFVMNSVIEDNGSDWTTFNDLNAYDKTLLTEFDYAWVINGSNFDLYRFDIVNQTWDLRVQNTAKASVTLNTAYNRYKAVVSGGTTTWTYEYTLNNSSFTAQQWAAINSGITSALVTQIGTNQTNIGNLNTNKADKSATVSNVSYDNNSKKLQQTINGNTSDIVQFGSNAFSDTAIPTQASDIGAETVSNKVTSLSNLSTDDQYPSAKCVYDMIGDVETLLTTINSGSGV